MHLAPPSVRSDIQVLTRGLHGPGGTLPGTALPSPSCLGRGLQPWPPSPQPPCCLCWRPAIRCRPRRERLRRRLLELGSQPDGRMGPLTPFVSQSVPLRGFLPYDCDVTLRKEVLGPNRHFPCPDSPQGPSQLQSPWSCCGHVVCGQMMVCLSGQAGQMCSFRVWRRRVRPSQSCGSDLIHN